MSGVEAPVAVHVGAGSLGRGLIVPLLTDAGFAVTVVDADRGLVERLRHEGAYDLDVVGGDRRPPVRRIPVADALYADSVGDLRARLAAAAVATTAVRVENLPRVADLLGRTLTDRPTALPLHIVACENAERASSQLATLLETVAPIPSACLFRDAVVDRICTADWPTSLAIRVEAYHDWTVELPAGERFPVPAATAVPNLDPYFRRKLYLVNTVADAIAFLGARRGYRDLHEAAGDPIVCATLAPAIAELCSVLARRYGLPATSLERYSARALTRLAQPAMRRALDTVARDGWRKLGVDERFVRPAGEAYELGIQPRGLARAIAAVLWGETAARCRTSVPNLDLIAEARARWVDQPWADDLAALCTEEWGYLVARFAGGRR